MEKITELTDLLKQFVKKPFAFIAFFSIVAGCYIYVQLSKRIDTLHSEIAKLNIEKIDCERRATEREKEMKKEYSKNYSDLLSELLKTNKKK